jgi:hypothetical protein
MYLLRQRTMARDTLPCSKEAVSLIEKIDTLQKTERNKSLSTGSFAHGTVINFLSKSSAFHVQWPDPFVRLSTSLMP